MLSILIAASTLTPQLEAQAEYVYNVGRCSAYISIEARHNLEDSISGNGFTSGFLQAVYKGGQESSNKPTNRKDCLYIVNDAAHKAVDNAKR